MLTVYIPAEYHTIERVTRVPFTFGIEVSGGIDKADGKVVWAVADGTAQDLADRVVDYTEYDWSGVGTLCLGHDEESLIDSGKIKDHHDLVTIPRTSLSLQMDQAMAILLAHYVANYPDADREAKVQVQIERIQKMRRESRAKWVAASRTGEV